MNSVVLSFLVCGLFTAYECFSNNRKDVDILEQYLQLSREVADKYMADEKAEDEVARKRDMHTTKGASRAFHRASNGRQRSRDKAERETAELEAMVMLSMPGGAQNLRELNLAKRFDFDDSCNVTVNCTDTANLNFVDGIEFRALNGSCTNQGDYRKGQKGVQQIRLLADAYKNHKWAERNQSVTHTGKNPVDLPNPRNISNYLFSSLEDKSENDRNISIALLYLLQFISHDLAKTPEGRVSTNVACCAGPINFCMCEYVVFEEYYFRQGYCFDERRSDVVHSVCDDDTSLLNQMNDVTSFLDASNVYGSTIEEMDNLRVFKAGHLKESTREFMPNASESVAIDLGCIYEFRELCFVAGDTRANVDPGLGTWHTVFVREHNRIAKELADLSPSWSDERLFYETRKIVGAEMQHLVYTYVLPKLMPSTLLDTYGVTDDYTYNGTLDPSLPLAFSMAFRLHNLMPAVVPLGTVEDNGTVTYNTTVKQELSYNRPHFLTDNHFNGINNVALGMIGKGCPFINAFMNNSSRNLLFVDSNNDSVDLAAIDIRRGREWGMKGFANFRNNCDFGIATEWSDFTDTPVDMRDKLELIYAHPQDVDLWVGLITEDLVADGGIVGPTQACLLAKHFYNLKHGDRFWYENSTMFTTDQLTEIKLTSFSRLLCDNLPGVMKMRTDIFDTSSEWTDCTTILSTVGMTISKFITGT